MLTDFRLLVFDTVARKLSFTKAAETLYVTQPAVTKHIKELEREIGDALFVRNGNKISLTKKAEELLPYVREVLSQYQSINDAIAQNRPQPEGRLLIGASTTISQYLLPGLLARFRKRHPQTDITLLNGNSEQIEQKVISGEIELGIIEDDAVNPALRYEPFTSDEIVLVTRSGNKAKASLSPQELTTIPLVIRESGSGTLSVIDHFLKKSNLSRKSLNIEIELGSSESIKHYLLHSDSYAFISLLAVSDYLADGKLKIIETAKIERWFRFVSLHGKQNPLTELFRNFCFLETGRIIP